MKTPILLLGTLLSLATACESSNGPTATVPTKGAAVAKANKDATETPATPAKPEPKPNVQKREGRTPLPAHLFM